MRHRVYGKHLGRDKNQRTALFRGLIRNLILHGAIQTTETKAKSIKGAVDRLVVKAKKNNQASLNAIRSAVVQKEIVEKLIKEIGPKYTHRNSGFTETVKMGRRQGDGAMVVRMSLIEGDQKVNLKEKGESKEEASQDKNEEVVQEDKKQSKEKPGKVVRKAKKS